MDPPQELGKRELSFQMTTKRQIFRKQPERSLEFFIRTTIASHTDAKVGHSGQTPQQRLPACQQEY